MFEAKPGRVPVSQYLFEQGTDPTQEANYEANRDFSGGPKDFIIQPPITQNWEISQLNWEIVDVGTFTPDKYGALTALDPGIIFCIRDDEKVIKIFSGIFKIKDNASLQTLSGARQVITTAAGQNFASTVFDFGGMGEPLTLVGKKGGRLAITLNDNFTALEKHRFYASGYESRGVGHRYF